MIAPALLALCLGQGASSPALRVDDAVAQALEHNPDLVALRGQLAGAAGDVRTAGTIRNPTLRFDVLHLQDLPAGGAGVQLQLAWEPPRPHVLIPAVRSAEQQRDAVRWSLAAREQELQAEVLAVHAQLLFLKGDRALLEEALERRRALAAAAGRRNEAGAGTQADVALASVAVLRVERQLDALDAQELGLRRRLGAALGAAAPVAAEGELPILPALDAPAPEPTARQRAAQAKLSATEALVEREAAKAWPWFDIVSGPRARLEPSPSRDDDFSVGLRFTLPVADWNVGPLAVARAERDVAEGQAQAATATRQRDAASARALVEVRRGALQRAEAAEQEAARVADAAQRALEGGQLPLTQALATFDLVVDARRARLSLQLDTYLAALEWRRAQGLQLKERP